MGEFILRCLRFCNLGSQLGLILNVCGGTAFIVGFGGLIVFDLFRPGIVGFLRRGQIRFGFCQGFSGGCSLTLFCLDFGLSILHHALSIRKGLLSLRLFRLRVGQSLLFPGQIGLRFGFRQGVFCSGHGLYRLLVRCRGCVQIALCRLLLGLGFVQRLFGFLYLFSIHGVFGGRFLIGFLCLIQGVIRQL